VPLRAVPLAELVEPLREDALRLGVAVEGLGVSATNASRSSRWLLGSSASM